MTKEQIISRISNYKSMTPFEMKELLKKPKKELENLLKWYENFIK